jgi:hypothetical protein
MTLLKRCGVLSLLAVFLTGQAHSERIENPVGVFSGLDKVTAITKTFEAKLGEEITFGNLRMKMFACYTRPITERPDTAAFVQIFTGSQSDANTTIFSGWLFAESPGLNALENPVYDIWLTGCRDPNAPPPTVEARPAEPPETESTQPEEPED